MTTSKMKNPLGAVYTKEYVDEIRFNNKAFALLVETLDRDYILLFNNKLEIKEKNNIYYFDPALLREFIEASKSGEVVAIDEVLAIYSDWLVRLESMLRLNAQHYHSNKVIKNELDEAMLMLLPNAKNITGKVTKFVDEAEKYFLLQAAQKQITALERNTNYADLREEDIPLVW